MANKSLLKSVPKIAEVLSYHGYRTFIPWEKGGKKVAYIHSYKSEDEVDQLQHWLAEQKGTYNDNHHGWLVKGQSGNTFFFRFSDWTLSVWLMPKES